MKKANEILMKLQKADIIQTKNDWNSMKSAASLEREVEQNGLKHNKAEYYVRNNVTGNCERIELFPLCNSIN